MKFHSEPYRKDRDSTSARNKSEATYKLCQQLPPIRRFRDFLAGIGIQSDAVHAASGRSIERGLCHEVDDVCLERLTEFFDGVDEMEVVYSDFFEDNEVYSRELFDLSLFDFNRFTILSLERIPKLKEALLREIARCNAFILTDISSSKWWINHTCYGCAKSEAGRSSYYRKLEKQFPGFRFVAAEGRTEAMYLLFQRSHNEESNRKEAGVGDI